MSKKLVNVLDVDDPPRSKIVWGLLKGATEIDLYTAPPHIGPTSAQLRETADEIERLEAEVARLRAALAECAAEWSSNGGTVLSCAAEVAIEFQRRIDIAGAALSGAAEV